MSRNSHFSKPTTQFVVFVFLLITTILSGYWIGWVQSIILAFTLGYMAIAFEHNLKMEKAVPAVLMSVIIWTQISISGLPVVILHDGHLVASTLEGSIEHHMGKISSILFFLISAMTIVELISLHQGFDLFKKWIRTKNKVTLLYIVSIFTFFLSATIDNLTTTIVMITLLRKLITNQEERWYFVGLIVIVANAGGTWLPTGDLTTTMLWLAGKVTTGELIESLFLPSLIAAGLPVFVASRFKAFQGNITVDDTVGTEEEKTKALYPLNMLLIGLSAILFAPIFHGITGLPPLFGMLLGLGLLWYYSEKVHPEETFEKGDRYLFSALHALSRIELASVVFFLGILLAVAGLESISALLHASDWLDRTIPSREVVIFLLGLLSSVIDNVPLVAGTLSMYHEPPDSLLWLFITYCTANGGSMLIIGSAAGVAAMGLEKIPFFWYLKKIAWLAFLGYVAGAASFLALYHLLH